MLELQSGFSVFVMGVEVTHSQDFYLHLFLGLLRENKKIKLGVSSLPSSGSSAQQQFFELKTSATSGLVGTKLFSAVLCLTFIRLQNRRRGRGGGVTTMAFMHGHWHVEEENMGCSV